MIHRYIIEATDEVKGFEEAIERLDREWGIEELELCEDAISRQAVLNAIMANCIWENEYNLTSSSIKKAVESLPSVNPQPKIGHWITTRTIMHDGEYYCDKCDCDSPHNEKWDYCPNCGAKMESEE